MQYDILKGRKGTNPLLAFFAEISSDTTTVTTHEISFAGYDALVFHITAPVLTDGTYTPKILVQRKSDDVWVALDQATDKNFLNGVPADSATKYDNAALSGNAEEGKSAKIGVLNVQDLYKAARLDIVSTGTTVGATIHANAVLGHANNFQAETQKP